MVLQRCPSSVQQSTKPNLSTFSNNSSQGSVVKVVNFHPVNLAWVLLSPIVVTAGVGINIRTKFLPCITKVPLHMREAFIMRQCTMLKGLISPNKWSSPSRVQLLFGDFSETLSFSVTVIFLSQSLNIFFQKHYIFIDVTIITYDFTVMHNLIRSNLFQQFQEFHHIGINRMLNCFSTEAEQVTNEVWILHVVSSTWHTM